MSSLVFQKKLYQWFQKHGRDLPWRRTKDPYAIWVSEIMLQQTQVSRVRDFYVRFLERFPNVWVLAEADWEEVLEYWRGLGYYRRARNLHRAAQALVQDFGGKFPSSLKELQKLPGIGLYTASAIMSFAFDEDVVALDTNLRRVFSRFFGESWSALNTKQQIEKLHSLIGKGKGAIFNHALMDIGATICLSGKPLCEKCPLESACVFDLKKSYEPAMARNERLQRSFSLADKPFPKAIKVAVGIVIQSGKVLMSRRPQHVMFGGLWEFPGGKLEQGEDERACLKRELLEELGIEVSVRPAFYKTLTQHEGQRFALSFHRCSILLGEPKALQVQEFRWVKPEELFSYQFPPVNQEVISLLLTKKAMFRV